ncbi:DUF126 domain-containing protein [bacterium]|nr:DUF126 domain-containing protein [bacterium]
MVKEFHGKGVVKGVVTAEVVIIPHSFSFLGDVEMNLGTILAGENKGIPLKNKILIFTESKGSSGGCVVLLTLVKKQLSPVGIVTVKMPDYNLAEGAILSHIPFLANVSPDIFDSLQTGDQAKLDTINGIITLIPNSSQRSKEAL